MRENTESHERNNDEKSMKEKERKKILVKKNKNEGSNSKKRKEELYQSKGHRGNKIVRETERERVSYQ